MMMAPGFIWAILSSLIRWWVSSVRGQCKEITSDLAKKLRKIYIVQSQLRVGKFVVGQNLHAETFTDIREDLADLAGTDNTYGLAVQIKAGQAGQTEIEILGAGVGPGNMPVQAE